MSFLMVMTNIGKNFQAAIRITWNNITWLVSCKKMFRADMLHKQRLCNV